MAQIDAFAIANYADFKLIAAQFASGHIFFIPGPPFKCWAMASGFPVLNLVLPTQPASFLTDFAGAVQLSVPLSVGE